MRSSHPPYPDRSDIMARKLAGRQRRAALTFAEKLVILDELRGRVQPIVEARIARSRRSSQAFSPQPSSK